MDFRILGSLEVCDRERTVRLGGDKQRALLALLLLHANEVVSADRLIDDLWGARPPPAALKALQAHISRLRKALDTNGRALLADNGDRSAGGEDGVLITRGHGYLLRVAPGELDLDRFRAAVEEGREALAAGDAGRAAAILRDGLALWRGPPLADFAYEAFAQAAIAQLEDLHLSALEERVEADLALGRQRDVVGELTSLVQQNPLRERVRGQLMLALYRSDRQAEALQVYQEFRRALSEQLGLDPGPGLQQLEVALLNRDASLQAPPANGSSVRPPDDPRHRHRHRPRRWWLVAATTTVIAIVAVVVASTGSDSARFKAIAADSVGAINPARGAITAVVPVGSSPSYVAAGADSVWVANYNANSISRIDPVTHTVEQTIPVDSTPSAIAVGARAVWVANNFNGTVSRIDPAADRVPVQTIQVGNGPSGIAVGDGAVWVSNGNDGTLSELNAVTGLVVKTIPLGGATDVAVGLGAVWVSDAANGRVLRINPQTRQVTDVINVGTGPSAMALGEGSLWVANSLDGTVSRIDPRTDHVTATILVGNGPGAIAVATGGVWVADEFGRSVVRIDSATDAVARTVTVGNYPRGLAAAGGLIWVSAQDSGARHRGGTLAVLQNAQFGSLDPARPGSVGSILTLYMTNDGLTAFKRVGGSDGAQVVPDLAVSLPTPTNGGLTYTFQLRSGIRYSNGQPVLPEDFRRAIERNFTLGPGAPLDTAAYAYFEDVVGAAACIGRTTRCDLSRGIVTDDAARTVTFHLVSPDPELAAHLALWDAAAVPASAPDHDVGSRPLPATGPYEVALDTHREVKLVRNPYFREWSHAAQPDGFPNQIVWRLGATGEAAVTAVERGSADYTLDPPPPDRIPELLTRFASQLEVNPTDETILMGLNTKKRPFTDPRVRQALSYAINRSELSQLLGQDSHPICQMLPPFIPGHRPYCPYTLNPSKSGVWHAPNLGKARSLIAASGTRGTPITIWNQPGFSTDFTASARYVASLLDQLGYPTRIRSFSVNDTKYLPRLDDSRTSPQVYFFNWTPNYPAPSEFLGQQFWSCKSFIPNSRSNNNLSEFCDPQFDATVRSALAAEAAKSPTAAQLWSKADRQFTDQAPTVNLANPSQTDLVSHRVGNYEYNPQLGVLLDQLWVH
jgi:peptide/nickel transport system substrate-binding protein